MFIQTLGSLILVVCVSYHLITASWQVVLFSFVLAGIGYATWIVRKAIIRRAKIKALWRRSIEIDEILEVAIREEMALIKPAQAAPVPASALGERRPALGKTCVAFEGPAKKSASTDGGNTESITTASVPTNSGILAHVVRECTTDPSKRVYKFSMKALANSRVKSVHDQAIMV